MKLCRPILPVTSKLFRISARPVRYGRVLRLKNEPEAYLSVPRAIVLCPGFFRRQVPLEFRRRWAYHSPTPERRLPMKGIVTALGMTLALGIFAESCLAQSYEGYVDVLSCKVKPEK